MLDARMDVIGGQIRIVVTNDLTEWDVLIDQFQDVLHRDTRSGDARFSEVDLGVDGDTFHRAGHHYASPSSSRSPFRCSSSAKWQADRCPSPPTGASGGSSCSQIG